MTTDLPNLVVASGSLAVALYATFRARRAERTAGDALQQVVSVRTEVQTISAQISNSPFSVLMRNLSVPGASGGAGGAGGEGGSGGGGGGAGGSVFGPGGQGGPGGSSGSKS